MASYYRKNFTLSLQHQAWLGLYKGSLRDLGWTEQRLVDEAAVYARDVLRYKGADVERSDGYIVEPTGAMSSQKWRPPPILSRTVGKMGLRGKAVGLNVVKELPGKEGIQRGPGGRGGRGATK